MPENLSQGLRWQIYLLGVAGDRRQHLVSFPGGNRTEKQLDRRRRLRNTGGGINDAAVEYPDVDCILCRAFRFDFLNCFGYWCYQGLGRTRPGDGGDESRCKALWNARDSARERLAGDLPLEQCDCRGPGVKEAQLSMAGGAKGVQVSGLGCGADQG